MLGESDASPGRHAVARTKFSENHDEMQWVAFGACTFHNP